MEHNAMEASYTFDPCSLDAEEVEEKITLDNWRPRIIDESKIVRSNWRDQQNKGLEDIQPGLDELKKILVYIKKNKSETSIMDTFKISAETLIAIKKGLYDPVDGIYLDDHIKVIKQFQKVDKKLTKLQNAITFIAETMLDGMPQLELFQKLMGTRARAGRKTKEAKAAML